MKTDIIHAQQSDAISMCLYALRKSALVAFPTDTVYGLGALVDDERAIEQLYVVKKRPAGKAIPVLIGSPDHLEKLVSYHLEYAHQLVTRFWPGPLTLILPRSADLPQVLSDGETIGVRMPDHPLALQLLDTAGPLAVTSAKLSGNANAQTAGEVFEQLGGPDGPP